MARTSYYFHEYALAWCQMIGYFICFCLSYYYIGDKSAYILALPLTWSVFGLMTIGHDCGHHAFFPFDNQLSRQLDKILQIILIDGAGFSHEVWNKAHTVHHAFPNTEQDTQKKIFDSDVLTLLSSPFAGYFLFVIHFIKAPKNIQFVLGKILFVAWFHKLPYVTMGLYFVFCGIFLIFTAVLGHLFLPLNYKSNDDALIAIRNAWDFYPSSHLVNFFAFGLNAHATHHVYPNAPRCAHIRLSNLIKSQYGNDDYHVIG